VARLVGVAATVHVGEVEVADGAECPRVGEEFADRCGAADFDDQDLRPPPQGMSDVLRLLDAAFEEVFVELVRVG